MKRIFMILFASVMFLAGCVNTGDTEKENMLDEELKDVNGNDYKLSSLKGKPTVIKVWASWCSICLSGLKHYNELSAIDIDANVISMVEPGKNGEMKEDEFSEWYLSLDDYKNITVLLDTKSIVKSNFFVRAYPTLVYLNENGEVVKTHPGHQSNEDILKTLEEIRKE